MGLYGHGDPFGLWPMTSQHLRNAIEPWLNKPEAVKRLQEEANLEYGSLDAKHGGFRENAEAWIRSHDLTGTERTQRYRPLESLALSARFRRCRRVCKAGERRDRGDG